MKNKKIAIVVDSASGVKPNQMVDVYVVPLLIIETLNNQEKSYRDGEEINFDQILSKLAAGIDLKTSQANMGDLYTLADKIESQYDEIYVLPISKNLSSSYDAWVVFAKEFPKFKILDTEDVGTGLWWTALEVQKMARVGYSLEDIKTYVEEVKSRRCGLITVNNVDQLVKGGRVSNFKALLIKTLNLKLIIKFQKKLVYFDKAKNIDQAILKTKKELDKVLKFQKKGVNHAIIYFMIINREQVKEIKTKIFKAFPNIDFEISHLPSVITTHTGGDSFAIYLESNK